MVSDWHIWTSSNHIEAGLNPCSNGIWSLTWVRVNRTSDVKVVLILVLMEYGLWLPGYDRRKNQFMVLILVLMEYGLWQFVVWINSLIISLNPCSNGIWSLTSLSRRRRRPSFCLNPCSNGIWSLTWQQTPLPWGQTSLNPCSNGIWSLTEIN